MNTSVFNNEKKLKEIVSNSYSYIDVCRAFDIQKTGKTYNILKKYIEKFNISTHHFDKQQRYLKEGYQAYKENKDIFIENSTVDNSTVRKRILQHELIEYKCAGEGCFITDNWLGKQITLQLEHKNGNNKDNRIENLCFLCPNCHSITLTWGGRNIHHTKKAQYKKKPRIMIKLENDKENFFKNVIIKCNSYKDILDYYNLTVNTAYIKGLKNFLQQNQHYNIIKFLQRIEKNIVYPPIEELLILVKENGFSATGRKLGCSDNAIRKYLKKHRVAWK